MTLADLIDAARAYLDPRPTDRHTRAITANDLARAVLDLLAESAPCGLEVPHVDSAGIYVPATWVAAVTAGDARGMARMLMAAADESEVGQ